MGPLHRHLVFRVCLALERGQKPLVPQEALIHRLVVVRLMPRAQPLLQEPAIRLPCAKMGSDSLLFKTTF